MYIILLNLAKPKVCGILEHLQPSCIYIYIYIYFFFFVDYPFILDQVT